MPLRSWMEEQAEKEGRAAGRAEGRLLAILESRFGVVGPRLRSRLEVIPLAELVSLSAVAKTVTSIDEFERAMPAP